MSDRLEPPCKLAPAELVAWHTLPRCTQRLIIDGAPEQGRNAKLTAARVIGAESAYRRISLDTAITLATAAVLPNGRDDYRTARWAAGNGYRERSSPGCCRNGASSKLQAVVVAYCDDACKATCPYITPTVAETPYAHVIDSALWKHGGGLGKVGRAVYATLALLAHRHPEHVVRANATYVCLRMDGGHRTDVIRPKLAALQDVGLTEHVDDEHIRLPAITPQQLRELLSERGIRQSARARPYTPPEPDEWNVRAALREIEQARQHDYDRLHGDEKIRAWSFSPPRELDTERYAYSHKLRRTIALYNPGNPPPIQFRRTPVARNTSHQTSPHIELGRSPKGAGREPGAHPGRGRKPSRAGVRTTPAVYRGKRRAQARAPAHP